MTPSLNSAIRNAISTEELELLAAPVIVYFIISSLLTQTTFESN